MADGVGHLVNRSGRDQARIAVPKDLGDAIGKTEPRRPLGGDYRLALRLVPGAVAHPQREIAVAGRKAKATPPGSRPARPDAGLRVSLSRLAEALAGSVGGMH